MSRDRPRDFLVSKICGNAKPINPSLAARQKISRLPGFGSIRFDFVIGTGRNYEFLFPIAVEVAEYQIEGAVGIADPSFEVGHDILAGVESHLGKFGG